jgi:hypothetical protein
VIRKYEGTASSGDAKKELTSLMARRDHVGELGAISVSADQLVGDRLYLVSVWPKVRIYAVMCT